MIRVHITFSVVLFCSFAMVALPAPAIPSSPLQYCPVHRDSNANNSKSTTENNTQVIDVLMIKRNKIRIQFYSPNSARAIVIPEATSLTVISKNASTTSSTTTPIVPPIVSSTVGANTDAKHTTSSPVSPSFDAKEIFRTDVPMDILCQWEFRAANESEYLLLTFDSLSAPYSIDCSDAYVSMQKDNGYESRWCGNRRQANARPMAIFSKTSAKITVFRKQIAPSFPQTGFSVAVESLPLDIIGSNNGVENYLRVLAG